MGKVYLIHFARPFHHAKHYVGYTDDIDARMERHLKGDGSRLLRAVNEAGIEWEVVKVWNGDRTFERKIKDQKNTPRICPVCNKEHK